MRTPEKEFELTTFSNVKLFKLDVTDSKSIDNAYQAMLLKTLSSIVKRYLMKNGLTI